MTYQPLTLLHRQDIPTPNSIAPGHPRPKSIAPGHPRPNYIAPGHPRPQLYYTNTAAQPRRLALEQNERKQTMLQFIRTLSIQQEF